MSKIAFLLILSFFFTAKTAFGGTSSHFNDSAHKFVQLDVFIAPVFGVSANDFFVVYKNPAFIGGQKTEFNPTASLGIWLKYPIIPAIRVGISAENYSSHLLESYSQFALGVDSLKKGVRNIQQDFSIKTVPILLTAEWCPSKVQFRSFAGAGIGVALISAAWRESLTSTYSADLRTGGTYLNQGIVAPAIRLYAGTEMGFDQPKSRMFMHSLSFDLRFTFIPASFSLFKKLAPQFKNPPSEWSDETYFNVGGISFSVSLNFELPVGKKH